MKSSEKKVIAYHRSYRMLKGSGKLFLLQFFLMAVPVSVASVVFYPEISRIIASVAQWVLTSYFPSDAVNVSSEVFIPSIGEFFFLALPSAATSQMHVLITAFVCLVILIFLPLVEKMKPVVIFLVMLSFIQLISALFFYFVPERFPYPATEFSRLYMLQQISICFFVPLIMGFGILSLPGHWLLKLVTVWGTYLYSLFFGTVRYVVFLYILGDVSMIYMAILYFALGPLVDFFYITGIYSLFVVNVTKKLKGDYSSWKWQYSH